MYHLNSTAFIYFDKRGTDKRLKSVSQTIQSILRQQIPGREILVWGDLPEGHDIKVFSANDCNVTGELNLEEFDKSLAV